MIHQIVAVAPLAKDEVEPQRSPQGSSPFKGHVLRGWGSDAECVAHPHPALPLKPLEGEGELHPSRQILTPSKSASSSCISAPPAIMLSSASFSISSLA